MSETSRTGSEGTSRRTKVGLSLVAVLVVLVAAAFVLILGGRRDLETVGQPSNPFVFLVSPAYEASPEQLASLSALLGGEAGFAVEVRRAADAEGAIVAAGTARVDAGLLPLFDYLFCRQEYGVQAGARVLREGGAASFHGEILVRADGGITTLGELSGRSVAFVSPHSTSGFLYPARLLGDAGAVVVPQFAGSHRAALDALGEGKAEAAATYQHPGPTLPGLRVLARTTDIPNEPVFFRAGLSPDLRQRFLDAVIRVAASERGKEILRASGGITGFAPVQDQDYAGVHQEIAAASKQLQDLVPGGWRIHRENLRPGFDPAP